MAVLTVIATIYALLLAFVAVSVWQSFGAAETAVVNEANSVGELARDLSIFDSAESRAGARGRSASTPTSWRRWNGTTWSGDNQTVRHGTPSTECFTPSAS